MKRSIVALFILSFVLFVNKSADAVIAYPYPAQITQPDGSKLTIINKGDEHIKWAETVDGYSIMRNSKKIFEYATLDLNNDMVPSGIKAKDEIERSSSDNLFLSKTKKSLRYSKSQIGMMKSISRMINKSSQKSFPTTGSRKLVCILMRFTDVPFTKTKEDFENLFNQVGYTADGATGSVKDYYKENSYNQLDLTVTVAGPYPAAHNMAYYGANGSDGYDVKPDALVSEAVNAANGDVNYADFDNDNNGYVDGVYVIYAGYGEEVNGVSEDAIWAHAWEITPVTLDNKIITSYSCSAELRGNSGSGINRIGVICHEFGHVMGASDFYDTDYADNGGDFYGTGNWDIMANGSWNNNGATPAHHNPYTKIYVYGWATATTISSTASITLNNAEQYSNSFYRINTPTTNEYFLIENRQKTLFDAGLPGHGMIIYHVDGNYINSHVNSNDINIGSHQGFYPVCASSLYNPSTSVSSYGDISSASCPFPGTSLKTSFTDATTPNSHSWAGASTNKPITSISENTTAKTVTFTATISTGINTNQDNSEFLGQNYPNPFNQSTTIDFKIEKPSNVTLTIYNNLGQVVDVLVNEYMTAGNYSKQWIPLNAASGIYFYQLNANGEKQTKRLVKM